MREDALHVFPGRIFSNEGTSSVASIYTQQGCKGINQDAMILWEVSQSKIRIASCYHRSITIPPIVISSRGLVGLGLIYVYVFDPGLRWSRRRPLRCVRRPRPPRPLGGPQGPGRPPPQAPLSSPLSWRWPQPYGRSCFCFGRRDGVPVLDPASSVEEPSLSVWREAFVRSSKAMDKELRSHPSLDCFCSGSTAVILLKLVCSSSSDLLSSIISRRTQSYFLSFF